MTSVVFRVNDINTREFAKGLFGKNRKRETFMSSVQTRGIVETIRDASVVEDWDISDLKVGQAILGIPDNMPFKFQFERFKK